MALSLTNIRMKIPVSTSVWDFLFSRESDLKRMK